MPLPDGGAGAHGKAAAHDACPGGAGGARGVARSAHPDRSKATGPAACASAAASTAAAPSAPRLLPPTSRRVSPVPARSAAAM